MHKADERLSDKQFSAKYGAKILAKYQVVEEPIQSNIETESVILMLTNPQYSQASGLHRGTKRIH
jgi:hypothetical protein